MSTPQDFETLLRDFTESVRRHAMDPNRHNANDLVYEREVILAYVAKLTPIWRSEPPNEPGWYWCRSNRESASGRSEPVEVYQDGSALLSRTLYPMDFRAFDWAGPLPPPQEKV